MTAGYSDTPLSKKLGGKPDQRVVVLDEPAGFRRLLTGTGGAISLADHVEGSADVVVWFLTRLSDLESRIESVEAAVFPAGMIWFAWPKRASSVETDLSRDAIRAFVLERRLVDVKICAIDETWSGLKVVWRREHR